MFTITPAAAKQIKIAAEQGGAQGMPLRMAAKENKDGSIAYHMGFDEASDTDLRISVEEVTIIMDPSFESLLDECTLDFVEMDDGSWQFIFLNPRDPHYVPPKTN